MHAGIDRAAVTGAGGRGHDVPEVAAIAGYEVTLGDVEGDPVEHGYEQRARRPGRPSEGGRRAEEPRAVLFGADDDVAERVDDSAVGPVPGLMLVRRVIHDRRDASQEAGGNARGGPSGSWRAPTTSPGSSAPSVRTANRRSMERDRAR